MVCVVNPRLGHFTPANKTQYPLYRKVGGPQGRSDGVWKISPPPRFNPPTFQLVASRSTDRNIPTETNTSKVFKTALPRKVSKDTFSFQMSTRATCWPRATDWEGIVWRDLGSPRNIWERKSLLPGSLSHYETRKLATITLRLGYWPRYTQNQVLRYTSQRYLARLQCWRMACFPRAGKATTRATCCEHHRLHGKGCLVTTTRNNI